MEDAYTFTRLPTSPFLLSHGESLKPEAPGKLADSDPLSRGYPSENSCREFSRRRRTSQ